MNTIIDKAHTLCELYGGALVVFESADDVKAYIPNQNELDNPIPDIWAKRIQACEDILKVAFLLASHTHGIVQGR